MFAVHILLVALLAVATSAQPHFDHYKYNITLTSCRAPQSDLGVIRLLDANATHRVFWHHTQQMAAISLASQQFNASDSTRLVRPFYGDSCALVRMYNQLCQEIYATSDGRNHLATAHLCVTLACQTHTPVHWPRGHLHFDVGNCHVGQLIGRTTALGGSDSFKYELDNTNEAIDLQCHNSSAVLRVRSYLGTLKGAVNFTLYAADTRPPLSGRTVWVKTQVVLNVHCNVTSEAPQFDQSDYKLNLHHCLPSKTRPFDRLTVKGGEPPLRYLIGWWANSLGAGDPLDPFRVNHTTGELYLVKLLDPYRYTTNPIKYYQAKVTDAIGRVAMAKVHINETCDRDAPVRFTKQHYEFAFSNCSSNAEDEIVGRVEAKGNSSYHYVWHAHMDICDMIEVQKNTGYVSFGPATCRSHHVRCCHLGEVYRGAVTLMDTRTGRPAHKMAGLEMTNFCPYP